MTEGLTNCQKGSPGCRALGDAFMPAENQVGEVGTSAMFAESDHTPPVTPARIPVRILVADDHEVVRQGLRALLEAESGFEVCGEAGDGREAVKEACRLRPDVVVLDFSMPRLNGLEVTRQIRKALAQTAVLVLTAYDSEELARALLGAGALGYVLKSDTDRDLAVAVQSLYRRRPFFTSRVAKMVLEGYLKAMAETGPDGNSGHPLTTREREILQLLAEGKSNKEVAGILGITVKTAETHRAALMRKLDLDSVSDLVRYAVRNQVIEA
jgi:DNA-binding NarL/FixJ family response regulator